MGGFFGNLFSGAEGAARGFGPGVWTLAGDVIHDKTSNPGDIGKSKTYKQVVKPVAKSYAQMYGPLAHGQFGKFGHNLYSNPFGPILDFAAVASGGAGALAKGGDALAKAGVIADDSRLAQLGREEALTVPDLAKQVGQAEGKDVTLRMSSRNPLIRRRQVAINRMLNSSKGVTVKLRGHELRLDMNKAPVVGSRARLARTVGRRALKVGQSIALRTTNFKVAFGQLSDAEKAAWHLKARQLDPEGYKTLLEDGAVQDPAGTEAAMREALSNDKLNKAYQEPSKKLLHALEEGRKLSDSMTEEKVLRGYITETTAAEAPYRAQRLLHGAEIVGKKGEVLGEPTLRETIAKNRVTRLQKMFDRASAKTLAAGEKMVGPEETMIGHRVVGVGTSPEGIYTVERARTAEEAQSHLAQLEKQWNGFVDAFAQKLGHPHLSTDEYRAEQLRRNGSNGKYRKQQSGKTRSGRASGASGPKVQRLLPTVKDEIKANALDAIHKMIEQFPDDPTVRHIGELRDEMTALRERVNAHQEHAFDENPPTQDFGRVTEQRLRAPKRTIGHVLTPKGGTRTQFLGANLSLAKTEYERAVAARLGRIAKKGGIKTRGVHDLPGNEIPELAQRLADRGEQQPFYVPDTASTDELPNQSWAPQATPPAGMGSAKQNLGVLIRKGMINLHGDALSAENLRFARHVQRTDVSEALAEVAAKEPEGGLPKGYDYLKVTAGQRSATYTEKNAALLKEALGGKEDKESLLKTFTTDDPSLARVDGDGHRLIVPKDVAQMLAHEAAPTGNLVHRLLYNRPTSIWKHLVLGLRPAYMANIILSQHILGALQMAPGGRGVIAYINHLIPGARLGKLTDETVEATMPEQAHASFSSSVGSSSYKGLTAANKLYQGVMPATLQVENWLRRLMIEGWAMSRPEIRDAMARNGGDINAAFHEVAQSHPHVLDDISQRVDHAQGNYRSYSPAEQKLRQVVPFYGWDRHIVQSTYRLLAEYPFRTAVAGEIGEQGHRVNAQEFGLLPSYLQGLVRVNLPHFMHPITGRVGGLSTKAVGPFATDADLGELVASLAHGRAGTHTEEANNVNPLVVGLIEQVTGRDLVTGAPLRDHLNYGVGNVPIRAALELPQAKLLAQALGRAPLGKPKRSPASLADWRLELATLLGIPVGQYDLPHEHQIAGLEHLPPQR